ncbi:hypothetical protein OHA37_04375 [Streptomyces sp. NBC_00335]|uniref:hypothetical protein n=1 Tax=unclassified Streptomyces TaxID=2593676 RepID=UPI00225A0235|nr:MULTISPECIES: hypothetical protein [unclassified Streptomyces]MCX5403117.1 hypothetical protein [Streptomyces sp. NBC_00086]
MTITQGKVTATLGEVFPSITDTRIERWVPAHADLTWANVMGPDFSIIDWEDWGTAPRGLEAATLWGNALAVPALADRVQQERRADLESRDGKPMSLFFLSKIVGLHACNEDPLLVPARKETDRLMAELQFRRCGSRARSQRFGGLSCTDAGPSVLRLSPKASPRY